MQKRPPLLVFSDLDGTLLDHDTYDWSAARPALQALSDCGAGVILASSKTAAEIGVLQADMGLGDWPAIVENGAGLLSAMSDNAGSSPYDEIRAVLDKLPDDLRAGFRGFGDMSVAEVQDITGLAAAAAAQAKDRRHSEPGLWTGDTTAHSRFLKTLAAHDIQGREGGRFLTLSFGKTKADQMAAVIAQYKPHRTIALGDAPNDIEMLETADIGIVVANPHRPPLPPLRGEAEGRIRRTIETGPRGWNTAMRGLLAELEIQTGTDNHG
ncbi:HAD-IIB family hydrolase [Yoonia sp. SS1-5]|uniref:HAD-IIB family hydrolase n=1 Tax=Yoonia rhodophyticola TaxID=3137370 RepID=A0AAN0MB81_9RHOB